jgi:hypothetical protein
VGQANVSVASTETPYYPCLVYCISGSGQFRGRLALEGKVTEYIVGVKPVSLNGDPVYYEPILPGSQVPGGECFIPSLGVQVWSPAPIPTRSAGRFIGPRGIVEEPPLTPDVPIGPRSIGAADPALGIPRTCPLSAHFAPIVPTQQWLPDRRMAAAKPDGTQK